MDINNTTQFENIVKITKDFETKVTNSNLSSDFLHTVYATIFLPKIKYFLPTTYLSKQQSKVIN